MKSIIARPLSRQILAAISFATVALLLYIFALAGPALATETSNSTTASKQIVQHTRVAPTLDRLSGETAIHTSAAVSKKYYAAGTDVVYIVNRNAFADGVIASSMKTKGPILYTNTDSFPSVVTTELKRLKPKRVVIVGGGAVVSDAVSKRIRQIIPSQSTLERLSGADRYQTAVNVSKADYPNGSNTVYVANGTAYSDALIATQQASTGPVLYSLKDSIKSNVIDEINRLNAKQVVIVGGSAVVSDGVVNTIRSNTNAEVSRISGKNRYDTAAQLSQELNPNGASQVFIAHGTAYADSILIGSIPSPGAMLYVSDHINDATQTELQRLGASNAVIIGGTVRVSDAVTGKIKQVMSGADVKQRLAPGVSYFVLAHPDDELASWAAIEASDYPVLILATQGEASNNCLRYGGKGSEQCRKKRLDSFHQFLDNYYTVTDHGQQAGGFHLFKGSDSARLIFDLGDGNLTSSEVTYAINQARAVNYGVNQENYVVSGNYWDNQRDPNCAPGRTDYACGLYDHADHRASYDAVRTYSYPNKLTFHGHYNPMVTAGAVMSKQKFESMIACPDGTYNQAYSWLNEPCWTRENSRWDHWQWMREY